MSKEIQKEGLFSATKKFTDAFFDGLKNNAVDRVLSKAKQKGVPTEVTDLMNKIREDKEQLDALLKRIDKL
jgi:hypothetical protein